MAKYHSEKEFFTDRTAIYDEHGNKVGYSEKAFFGDHVNIYDANGQKVGRQEQSLFGDHINVYDAKGNKVGEQHQSFFGDHTNIYDNKGNKVGESYSSFWGPGTDYYTRESTAPASSLTNQGNSYAPPACSPPPAAPAPQSTVLSSQIYSNISEEAFRKAQSTSHELIPQEATSFAKLCADLLEKAGVKTYGTVFKKVERKKKVRHGFLNLKSYETTETEYVPGEGYWCLRRNHENEERTDRSREEMYILGLTKSGKFYSGKVREDYLHRGGYIMIRNDWKECGDYELRELIPLLDMFLRNNKINMSSGMYWMQLHPEAAAPKAPAPSKPAPAQQKVQTPAPSKPAPAQQKAQTPAPSKPAPIQQKAQSPAPSKPAPAQQKAQTPAPSKPTPSQQPLSTEEQIKQKMAEINLYSLREAIFAMESLGGDFVDFMAGKTTLTKTKDNDITYDELLAELRKLYGDRNSK